MAQLTTNVEDADVAALMATMIERHCEWLNRHIEQWKEETRLELGIGPEHRYASAQFASETNRTGWRRLLATTLVGDSRLIVFVEIHDGDEGGPSLLTGFHDELDEALYRHKTSGEIRSSGDVDWWGAGNWGYDHSEHRGWRLSDLMLEFDTQRSHTLRDGELINCPGGND